MALAVTLNGITYKYGHQATPDVLVLDRLCLEIGVGQITAILGPSGCGKTTLLNIIAGITTPSSGEVIWNKEHVASPRRFGYVFQTASLIPWRTIRDNALFGGEVAGIRNDSLEKKAGHLLSKYGLHGYESAFPNMLSGGMQQRVSIIRAALSGAKVILLDEPFSNSDFVMRRDLQSEVSRLVTEEQLTAILVTHDVEEAVRIGDKVVVLSRRPAHVKATVAIPIGRDERLRGGATVLAEYVERVEAEFLSAEAII